MTPASLLAAAIYFAARLLAPETVSTQGAVLLTVSVDAAPAAHGQTGDAPTTVPAGVVFTAKVGLVDIPQGWNVESNADEYLALVEDRSRGRVRITFGLFQPFFPMEFHDGFLNWAKGMKRALRERRWLIDSRMIKLADGTEGFRVVERLHPPAHSSTIRTFLGLPSGAKSGRIFEMMLTMPVDESRSAELSALYDRVVRSLRLRPGIGPVRR